MCLQQSAVRPYQKWHWAGDEIVPDPIIPATRKVPGSQRTGYEIDIRSFLSNEHDAVVKKFLDKNVKKLPMEDQQIFHSASTGSYDRRAWFAKHFLRELKYIPSNREFDAWLFPEETLAQQGGDCEDLAFLTAALLETSGISQYCIRVALGSIVNHGAQEAVKPFDHAWVMYQNENGAWEIFDPAGMVRMKGSGKSAKGADVEYVPHFVFNRSHLWRIRSNQHQAGFPLVDYLKARSFWDKFNPSFAAGIHNTTFDEGLKGMSWLDLQRVKAASFAVDVNTLQYDPRGHFDFAYIDEGWNLVNNRLKTKSLEDFALAVHAIGDFYAHSFYGRFADKKQDGSMKIYDPSLPLPSSRLVYDFNPLAPLPGCSLSSPADAADRWKGKLISGQWWRWYSTFPSDLKKRSDFPIHRCLPDHDTVAVDSPTKPSSHKLFSDADYPAEFDRRKKAAIEHIATVYGQWKKQ